MDTKYLSYIITLAEEKNMTRAAERLFISQSSLSYYLSKLEQELGTSLFLRGKSELVLTPAGQLYIEAAQEVMRIKEQLYWNISHLDNRAHIRIFTTSLWGNQMLADILPVFKTAFPDVTFDLSHEDLVPIRKALQGGTIDFGLLSVGSEQELDDTAELLRIEELFFAVPAIHPYVQVNSSDTISQDELLTAFHNDIFLLSRKTSANRYLADQMFSKYKNAPSNICEVNGILLTVEMISRNMGVSLIPLSGKTMEDKIHYYSCSPKLYRYNILLHRKNLVLNKPEKTFFDYVLNYFEKT